MGNKPLLYSGLIKCPSALKATGVSRWHNMKVTVMKPDGTNETIGTFNSDSNGGASTRYTPTSVGTYTFYFEFPGQIAQNENPYPYFGFISLGLDYVNDTYAASSAATTLTVQQDAIGSNYGQSPLPTQYWARPINSMNREWSVIGGKWLGLGSNILWSDWYVL